MLAVLPFLAAPFPDEPPPTAPAPGTTGGALVGITFHSDWDGSTAKALTEAANGGGSGDAAVNAVVDVCCAPGEAVGPDCAELSGGSCPAGETRHTIKGWENSPSISHDGATLQYAYTQWDLAYVIGCFLPCSRLSQKSRFSRVCEVGSC